MRDSFFAQVGQRLADVFLEDAVMEERSAAGTSLVAGRAPMRSGEQVAGRESIVSALGVGNLLMRVKFAKEHS